MTKYPSQGYIADLNELPEGSYGTATPSITQNLPDGAPQTDMSFFCFGGVATKLQIGGREGNYFVRLSAYSNFGAWVKI